MTPLSPVPYRDVYSAYDMSLICGVDIEVAKEWIFKGEIPSFKVLGGHLRVKSEDLEAFLEKKNMPRPDNWTQKNNRYKVLLVEDEVDLLDIVGELLKEDERFEVDTEASGFGAALKIARWHPDAILLDFLMPGMDGFEVCKKLRRDPLTNDIPVIATTSLSRPENKEAVLKAGVSVFLGKPFQSDKMLQTVRQSLGIEPLSPGTAKS